MPSVLATKLLESGLVTKHAAELLERWKSLPDGSAELAETKKVETEEALVIFADEIEELLAKQECGKGEVVLP